MSRLTAGERDSLLRLAQASIAQRLTGGRRLADVLKGIEITPTLREGRGLFVSLKRSGADGGSELRGCIGDVTGSEPLFRAVIEVAAKAAFSDPRFAPLTEPELRGLRTEISVLTALTRLADPERLVMGRDGVRLSRGPASAFFLPQVADQLGGDRERFLRQLALKAGLGPDDWRGAELEVFQAEVFAGG